jgi:cyclophilin family peptidyl-prolyl cis-trans isomerase
VFEVFTKTVPKTAENFRQLCIGTKGDLYHYKKTKFHAIFDGAILQGGDTTGDTGTGGLSIYGHKFDDENIWFPHSHKGVVTTGSYGPNTNGSQFVICMGPKHDLNGQNTVFARVIHGMDILYVA